MAIKVGVLGVAKKVKRIYVGVDGKARRVILARAGTDDGSNNVCYSDTSATVLSSIFSPTVNVLSLCWCTYNGSTKTYTAAISGYVNPNAPVYSLTEISRGSESDTIYYTGRELALGSTANSYPYPKVSNVNGLSSIADYTFSGVSLSVLGSNVAARVELRKVSPYSMSVQQDGKDTGALTISTGATNLDYSSQSISQSWFNASWPTSKSIIVTISSIPGEQKCIVANADGSRKTFPYLAYPRTSGHASNNNLKVLVTDPSDGGLKLIGLEVYKNASTGETVSGVKGTSLIADANEYTDAFFGESYVPSSFGKAYRTVCYTSPDTSKRVCRLVYDTGNNASTFNITEYSEEFTLDNNEKSRASSYTWQILGAKSSSGSVYILSTVRDRLKIIILEHVDGGFSKKAELDLRKDLSDSVVVKDVVPSAYLEYTGYNDKDIFVPAVLLSHNNGEYYELIIARVNES